MELMKKYQTGHYDIDIKEIEVIRETEAFIILPEQYGRRKERRESKKSNYHLYHDTWEAAHAYLLERTKDKIAQVQDLLEKEKKDLRIIENMVER